MLATLAWTLQVMALLVVGLALLVGLTFDLTGVGFDIRNELGIMVVGGLVFLAGRWLEERAGSG